MSGIERASMDGNNRTIFIDVENITRSIYSVDFAILSFTLDHQAQVLYWIFGDESDHYLTLTSSNIIDGTNRQITSRLGDRYIDYYSLLYYYPPGITVHKETLLLSLSGWPNVVYSVNLELGANNENFTMYTFLNSSESDSVLCRYGYHQLKATKQPSGNKLYSDASMVVILFLHM